MQINTGYVNLVHGMSYSWLHALLMTFRRIDQNDLTCGGQENQIVCLEIEEVVSLL